MRPAGDVAKAILAAAQAPGTVRQVCARAGVGYRIGAYTCSRLLQRGQLHVVASGPNPEGPAGLGRRPACLATAPQPVGLQPSATASSVLASWPGLAAALAEMG